MRLKLDENLGLRIRALLAAAGHDVCTVIEQDLCSATDVEIAQRCVGEGHAIVTLPQALRRVGGCGKTTS